MLTTARRIMAKFNTELGWRTRLRSSPAMTSRRRCRPVSMPPVTAVGLEHCGGAQRRAGFGGEQVLG